MRYASKVAMCRVQIPKLAYDNNTLELWSTCVADDQFSSPKQIRWSSALGKLLVAGGTLTYIHLRNSDLSFWSKRTRITSAGGCTSVDADSLNVYWEYNNARLYKSGLNTAELDLAAYIDITNIRMIDASGDPDYIYVTSNNATDGHGVRKVRKSDMTVVASLLATGAGDGRFNNPLGIKYYGGYVYVADLTNNRIVRLDSDLTNPVTVFSTVVNLYDLDTNGTNWFISYGNGIAKKDMSWGAVGSIVAISYSLCLIPDQSDGNGQTIAITDNTNSHLARYKCSDLTQVGADVGSSGDGSASLFDPAITCVGGGTWYTDDGRSYYAASGAAPSQNGFTGIFWASAGPHRITFRPAGGLAAVTGLDCGIDAITSIKNLSKLVNCSSYTVYNNTALNISLKDFGGPYTFLYFSRVPIVGFLADLKSSVITIYGNGPGSLLTGDLTMLPAGLQTCRIYSILSITPGSIAHLTAIRDLRIDSMWPAMSAAESVDIVINSMWTARAAYTYATPSLQIGGTNPDPTGNFVDPVEGADWHEDSPGHWVPLTPLAKVKDLMSDVNGEGFNLWSITY